MLGRRKIQGNYAAEVRECVGRRFREGWSPGAGDGVPGSEARRELQEGLRAGIPGRGRTDGRNRGLELGAREELLGELLRSREGGK